MEKLKLKSKKMSNINKTIFIVLISLITIFTVKNLTNFNHDSFYNIKHKNYTIPSSDKESLMWRIFALEKRQKFEEAKKIEKHLNNYNIRSEGEYQYLLTLMNLEEKDHKNESELYTLITKQKYQPDSIKSLTNGAFLIAAWTKKYSQNISSISPIDSNKLESIVKYANTSSDFSSTKSFMMTNKSGTLMCWDLFKVSHLLKVSPNDSNLLGRYNNLKSVLQHILISQPFAFSDLYNFLPCLQVLVEENITQKFLSKELLTSFQTYLLPLLDHSESKDCMGTKKYYSYPRANPENKCRNNSIRIDTNSWLFSILSQIADKEIGFIKNYAVTLGIDYSFQNESENNLLIPDELLTVNIPISALLP